MQNVPEPRRPVTPTRVIPAGAPLPARAPEPGEVPPWRTPPSPPPPPAVPTPPPPPPPAPDAHPLEVRHIHEVQLVWDEPEPDAQPRLWARIWDSLCTWRMGGAIVAALIPVFNGHSAVGAWADTLHQARTEAGVGAAYVIAGVAVGAAYALDRHTGRWLPRFLLVTATVGSLGVLAWYDPILLLTGVHP